jgi:hypothetical protein
MHGDVGVDALAIFRSESFGAHRSRENLLEHLLDAIGLDLLSPLDQQSRMVRQLVLKVFVAAEVLPVGIITSLLDNRLVALVERVFEVVQPEGVTAWARWGLISLD